MPRSERENRRLPAKEKASCSELLDCRKQEVQTIKEFITFVMSDIRNSYSLRTREILNQGVSKFQGQKCF